MTYHAWSTEMLPAIESDLIKALHTPPLLEYPLLVEQLEYHMGWSGSASTGKRVRPMLVSLVNAACGGDWKRVLPASSAIELVHNFSLIHDDIEDHSTTRHGRPTLWAKWGEAHAINAGDAMFSAALASMLRLKNDGGIPATLDSLQVLLDACVALTGGQQLDISFESASEISIEKYMQMVGGKTASLLAASTKIGALTAGVTGTVVQKFAEFGQALGFAFQMVDDWLGIWGTPEATGKSTATDLLHRKKTLPVLYGIQNRKAFYDLWISAGDSAEQVHEMARLLEIEGAKAFTEEQAAIWTKHAITALEEAIPQASSAGDALLELTNTLIKRQK